MSVVVLLAGLLVATVLAAVVVAVVVLVGTRSPAPTLPASAVAARRHAAAVSTVAWASAVVVPFAGLVLAPGVVVQHQGVWFGLLPAVVGLVLVGVHAAGEVTWPRPSGAVRRASLVRRTAADVAPRWARTLLWSWVGVTVAVVIAAGLTAEADGRSVSRVIDTGSSGASPYPGWFYGLPLLGAALLVALTTEAVLRLVASRPTVVNTTDAWDLQMRRLSAHRVLRGSQLVVALTAGGLLLTAGTTLQNVGRAFAGDGTGSTVHVAWGLVCVVLAVVVVVTALGAAAVPAATPTAPVVPPEDAGARPVDGAGAVGSSGAVGGTGAAGAPGTAGGARGDGAPS